MNFNQEKVETIVRDRENLEINIGGDSYATQYFCVTIYDKEKRGRRCGRSGGCRHVVSAIVARTAAVAVFVKSFIFLV